MTAEQTTSQKAAPTPPPGQEATLKRGMRMSWFAEKKDHLEVGLAFEQTKDVAKSMRAVGQLVGIIWKVEEREFVGRDAQGEDILVKSLVAVGDFEAVKYSDGEVATTPSFALPKYYVESAKAALDAQEAQGRNNGLEFAIEIVLTPTGKQVPTAYEIRNLIPREVDSPINRLKQKVQATGRLRLPPPIGTMALDDAAAIEGEWKEVDAPADEPPHDGSDQTAAGLGGNAASGDEVSRQAKGPTSGRAKGGAPAA